MVLNIFPRPKKVVSAPEPVLEATLPEPSNEALEDLEPKKRPTRRGSRGGRGRGQLNGDAAPDSNGAAAVAEGDTESSEPAVRPARRSTRPRAGQPAEAEPDGAVPEPSVDGTEAAPRQGRTPRPPRAPRTTRPEADASEALAEAPSGKATSTQATILRAIEQHGHQIEQLIRLQEENARRGGSHGATAAPPPPRVGIFVDSANIELACDRLKTRFDWKKILEMLTRDRQLVRAIAYSPVHDDPGVSIETQRFVEPFLGKGYKVFTKPLKRFQDNTIKANVDIELALDVMEMIDRLDVVCLVSGDGDFQRLVEVVQTKGVQVEVVAVGSSTASQLRHAADHYIDLQQRVKDIRA